MRRHKRAALVSALADELHQHGSWVGETHLQKGVYLLQEMLGVPLDVDYVLFKHGPFSWQLREELGDMRADDILTLEPQRPPYGSRFYTGERAAAVTEKFPNTLARYRQQIEWVATHMGDLGVVDLERLATAFWVTQELPDASVQDRAKRLHELKPHFDLNECQDATAQIDEMLKEAPVVKSSGRTIRPRKPRRR